MLTIEIDGRPLEVKEGSMVIEAADAAGIYIPRFCYHKKLSVAANCRMCLVDVEKVAKPLPACATPVTNGMRVFTRSQKTCDAQRGVMEFLLINHPLDCPICDQGGECDLQDLAVGYGKDISRYAEAKRIVKDKNIGPLIATDMTRCIHCTRCVRFGQEIAGLMELGATGRGEHMRIGTYVEASVSSELSGNMIDLCPVGALTSKPFRYTARSWELLDVAGVSPHDCVGTNLTIQVRRNQVMRVLPRENEEINEVWISDRDRFSYTGLYSEDRLTAPMIRRNGTWERTDWQTALDFAVAGLKGVHERHGAAHIGALAAPTSTVEEFYLLQRLMRGLGSNNVDHRLRARDFRGDADAPLFPALGQLIGDLPHLESVLLVGSHIRKEQPLLAARVRQAFLNGARVSAVNPLDYDFTFDLAAKAIVAPAEMPAALARIARAVAAKTGGSLPENLGSFGDDADAAAQTIAESLINRKAAILLGQHALNHAEATNLLALAQLIATLSGASVGLLADANSAGAWVAGCVPHRGAGGAATAGGMHARAMLQDPRKAYVLLDVEPELDCVNGAQALAAMQQAEFVVALAPFVGRAQAYAHVLLPTTPFTETEGTFVNCEGRWQSFTAAVTPYREARPAWKVLRVLANLLGMPGFEFNTGAEVLAAAAAAQPTTPPSAAWRFERPASDAALKNGTQDDAGLARIAELPMYAGDSLVRRAPALQATPDALRPMLHINAAEAARLGAINKTAVRVQTQGEAMPEVWLDVCIDARVPDGCVYIPLGFADTAAVGDGPVRISRVP